jgi:EAL domain-containing protein (putative c-di-GMP-specific phosphodiesterase class I)
VIRRFGLRRTSSHQRIEYSIHDRWVVRLHRLGNRDVSFGRLLKTQEIVSREALMRWRHPTRGLVPPNVFIPIAEQTGLIGPLTSHVLEEALRRARALDDAVADLRCGLVCEKPLFLGDDFLRIRHRPARDQS